MSDARLRVRRYEAGSAPYQALLRQYLRGRLGLDPERPEDRRLAADIIRAADGRFAYVSFLADRLEQLPPGDLAGLGAGEGLYRHWLLGLDLEYGRKQADAMRQVLALLAAAEAAHAWVFDAGRKTDPATGGVLTPLSEQFEGLEVRLLARLLDLDRPGATSYDRIDPGLLVTLQTLQGVLWVWRGGGGASHFRLALKEFLPAAMGDPKLAPLLPLMQARTATRALDAIELIHGGEDTNGAAWGLLAPLAPLVEAAVQLCGSEPVMRRWRPKVLADVLSAYADALKNQGLALQRVPWWTLIAALAVRPWETAVSIDERNRLAASLQDRGLAKAAGGDLAGAVADYDAAVSLREAIRDLQGEAWSVPLRNNLAQVLQNRGLAKARGGDLASAIADYEIAIRLMEGIRDLQGEAWPVPLRNDFARSLQNRGLAKAGGGDLLGAIADYDAAVCLMEAIRDLQGEAWPVPLRNDLAQVLQNRGLAKAGGRDLSGAIADYDAAIALSETIGDELGASWPVPLRNQLADSLQNRGKAKAAGGDLARAVTDFDAAIRLREVIRDELGAAAPVSVRNDLATDLYYRALAKVHASNLPAAMDDIAASLAVQQPLVAALGPRCPPAYRALLDAARRLRATLSGNPTRPA
jgi:tetratricopeptide (TPR) repeat protein